MKHWKMILAAAVVVALLLVSGEQQRQIQELEIWKEQTELRQAERVLGELNTDFASIAACLRAGDGSGARDWALRVLTVVETTAPIAESVTSVLELNEDGPNYGRFAELLLREPPEVLMEEILTDGGAEELAGWIDEMLPVDQDRDGLAFLRAYTYLGNRLRDHQFLGR